MQSATCSPSGCRITVNCLVIGAGPAGASLACFLGQNGLTGLVLAAAPATADTPRAHITNMAALECLRDLGAEEECIQVGHGREALMHIRWCDTMAGLEYARAYSWGAAPDRKGDYEKASPCEHLDLPQTLLEPILTRRAAITGFPVRFSTVFDRFEETDSGTIVSFVTDKITNIKYEVESRYLFGADGARSRIQKQLALPLAAQAPKGVALNVLLRADLSKHIKARMGNCHFVMQPDRPHPLFGWVCVARMVKPWYEWMFILYAPDAIEQVGDIANEVYMEHINNLIGDSSIKVDILGVSKWYVNEIVAEKYSKGNILCLGDAVHRHPPANGLGSNTCIQDAYNLAWKIAYVDKGLASPKLLETYSLERQPVGIEIVNRANRSFDAQQEVWKSLGLLTPDASVRKQNLAELAESTEAGRLRRKAFRESMHGTRMEFHALGTEMGQRYQSSAILLSAGDEDNERNWSERDVDTQALEYLPSTQPGRRLPHVWLNTICPKDVPTSIHDLAGKGTFTLFIGHGGEAWREAAARVLKSVRVEVKVYSIGFGLDWEDVYLDWERLRGVEESGCVLVRPDRFVAWRGAEVLADEDLCGRKLIEVLHFGLGSASRQWLLVTFGSFLHPEISKTECYA